MRSICRNVTVSGRRTSVRMEPIQWESLMDICERERRTIHEVVTIVDRRRGDSSLTAALRVFILAYFRRATAPATVLAAMDPAAEFEGRPATSPIFQRALRIFEEQEKPGGGG